MDPRQVRCAWETFITDGVATPAVSRAVAASWQRSRAHDIRIQSTKAPLAQEGEIYRHRAECAALVSAARPVFSRSSPLLSEADAMLILTDPSGLILETQGDERVIEGGREIHLEHGGQWREADIGTNAIGTAVATARPVQIHGPEHFCSEIQKWTCAASPVRHPVDHEVLGVVDISGPADKFIPQSLALAVAISHHIEDNLARSVAHDRERLLQRSILQMSRWSNEELIVVDRRGAILHCSDNAVRALRLARADLVVDQAIPSLRDIPAAQWARKLSSVMANVSVELISDDAAHVGAIIVLRSGRRLSSERPRVDLARSRGAVGPPTGLARAQPADPRRAAATSMIADDCKVAKLAQRVEMAAARKMPILVLGETGTGKEQMARHAHVASGRRGAFVPVNCAALTESLAEAELFGYADGAFTGARRGGAIGFAQQADGGTLFLDEIGDMPIALQAVLLRFLDDWTARPIGGTAAKVDVFLVSATNMTLGKAIAEARFRSDLLYRLNTVEITLPRLAERSDFAAIARKLLAGVAPDCTITDAALRRLASRDWPGNIRELRNAMTRLTLTAEDGAIDEGMIELAGSLGETSAATAPPAAAPAPRTLHETGAAQVRATFEEVGRNISETSRRLGISRNTVYRLLGRRTRET